ncbi:hypothetical protein EP7_004613 [Isosphaeraceae bacterium EP7]
MKTNPNQSRKLLYGLAIVVIFGAIYPYTSWLNKVKAEKDLGEATIGQVDTGSFMLKLALLGGARGIAANVLWNRAEEMKRAQDWDKMKSTVDLITKLQPHFLSVWTFQGWNLAYNVSVEWDAPEDKYEWIKQGIKFLKDGVRKNAKSPDLRWDTAWTYYHKLGFSDETIILRRLFRDDPDDDFKTDPIENVVHNDNFLLGRGWFQSAIDLVDLGQERLVSGAEDVVEFVDAPVQRKGRPGDLAFRSMPPHAQTRYAAGLEKESIMGIEATFGEVAKNEWDKALREWVRFGSYTFPVHNNIEDYAGQVVKMDDATNPVVYDTLHPNVKYWTERWASQMNYPYWKDRCAAEKTDEGVQARRLFYEGTKAYKRAEFPAAKVKFEEGLGIWAKLLENHTAYRNDDLNKKDTGLVAQRYLRTLTQLNEEIPDKTPFLDLARAASKDTTRDPFDALEMMPTNSRSGATSPPPASR